MAVDKTQKAFVTEALRNLQVAIKSSSLYSVNHPTSVKAINTIFGQLQKLFEQKEVVAIQVTNGMVFFDRMPLERDNIHVKNFMVELTERNVTGLMFQRKISLEELRNFMRIVGMKASKIDDLGGLQKALSSENIQNIKITIFSPTAGAPVDLDGFGGLPALPEIQAFANFFLGKEGGLGAYQERFYREAMTNPGVVAQVVSRSIPEDAAEKGEHPVVHYLRSLDRIAMSFVPKVGESPEELRKIVAPVALSFDSTIKNTLLEDGREHAASAGKYVSTLYQDIVSEIIADQVRFDYKEGNAKGADLADKAMKLLRYAENPKVTVRLIEQKLKESGMSEDEIGDVLDHVYWNEYTMDEKFRRVMHGEQPWKKDIDKVFYTLLELIKADKIAQAALLFRSYLAGLREPDEGVKKDVAKNAPRLLEAFPPSSTREELTEHLSGELMGCLRAEPSASVAEPIVGSLATLIRADLAARQFARAMESTRLLEELLLAFDIQAWKSDLIRTAMRSLGDSAVASALVESLHYPEGGRDEDVAECVRTLGSNVVDPLIAMLGEEQDRIRRARIVEAIQIIGPPAENAILAALSDSRWYLVRNLAILLGEIGGERSIFSLEKVLSHRDPRVARAAVRSLNKIGTATAYRVLGRALEKGADDLRLNIIQTSASQGNEAMVPHLLDIARAKSQLGGDAIRKKAIDALGKIGSSQAVPLLAEILEKRSLFTMAEDVETRVSAARALGTIGGEEALETLERAARKDPKEDVRLEAQRFLGET